tara:strand:- start:432 stop:617 length:186 start_codon:yes stop_codon:yes gene_type:complete
MRAIVIDQEDPLFRSIVRVIGVNNDHVECEVLITDSDVFDIGDVELIRPEHIVLLKDEVNF